MADFDSYELASAEVTLPLSFYATRVLYDLLSHDGDVLSGLLGYEIDPSQRTLLERTLEAALADPVCPSPGHEWVGSGEEPDAADRATCVVTVTRPGDAAAENAPALLCGSCAAELVKAYLGYGWFATIEPIEPA
jgi:hypothetical protein